MAPIKLTIHVPTEAKPENVSLLISNLSKDKIVFSDTNSLNEYLTQINIIPRSEFRTTVASMEITHVCESKIALSPMGFALSQIREETRNDLYHYLMYTGWRFERPIDFLQSWAYRYCCDLLWVKEEVDLNSSFVNQLVEDVINSARDTFTNLGIQDFDEISFSRKSLNGVQNWLEALQPSVLQSTGSSIRYQRRAFCPPELLVMAIGYLLRQENTQAIEIDILLTREKREALCKICQLSPESLDRTLDWAIPTFSEVISPGTTAGFYGRFIRLRQMPTFENIIR